MAKKIRVLLVEDDPNSRDMMALILRSDWRIEVAGRTSTASLQFEFLQSIQPHIILVGGESLEQIISNTCLFSLVHRLCPQPKVVCAVINTPLLLHSLYLHPLLAGCLIKEEIGYSLSWALELAANGEVVATPGVKALFLKFSQATGKSPLILDGSVPLPGLSTNEANLLRIKLLTGLYMKNENNLEVMIEQNNLPSSLQVFFQWIREWTEISCSFEQAFQSGGYFAGKEIFLASFHDDVTLRRICHSRKGKHLLAYYFSTIPRVQKSF